MTPRKININVGDRFGLLVFVTETFIVNKSGHKLRAAICKCDCGIEKLIILKNLYSGNSTSCGCANGPSKIKHGMTNTRLYRIWAGLKDRCYNENHPAYKRYGGRGIKVCKIWLNNFKCFYKWAMENGYKDDLTIDRRKNNLMYSPKNCRWVDSEVQANNRRSNLYFLYNGKTMSLASICKIEGLKLQYKNIWRDLSIKNISLQDSILKRKNDLSITQSN